MRPKQEDGHGSTQEESARGGGGGKHTRVRFRSSPSQRRESLRCVIRTAWGTTEGAAVMQPFSRSAGERRRFCQPLGGRIKPSRLSDGRLPAATRTRDSDAVATSSRVNATATWHTPP